MKQSPIDLPELSRVAVIGAGPSGISAVSQLLKKGVKPDKIKGFESRSKAGGVWNYEKSCGGMNIDFRKDGSVVLSSPREAQDPSIGSPSPIYDSLRTNLPVETMTFYQTPYPEDVEMFPSSKVILEYLQKFSRVNNVDPIIAFDTIVTRLYQTPGSTDSNNKWTVESKNLKSEKTEKELFSHIIIANGHYTEPFIPRFTGFDTYKGELTHSRWWRNVTPYKEKKTILVIGGRYSASDILRDFLADPSPHQKIYQSIPSDSDKRVIKIENVTVVPPVHRVEGNTFIFEDGQRVDGVDLIVFATGYLFSYPFIWDGDAPFESSPLTTALHESQLSASSCRKLPRSGGKTITGLDMSDVFYLKEPTLALIGLHYLINPFPLVEITARLIAHSFVNAMVPSLDPIKRNSDKPDELNIGYPQEYENQDMFLDAIGEADGGMKVPQHLRELRHNALQLRKQHLKY